MKTTVNINEVALKCKDTNQELERAQKLIQELQDKLNQGQEGGASFKYLQEQVKFQLNTIKKLQEELAIKEHSIQKLMEEKRMFEIKFDQLEC